MIQEVENQGDKDCTHPYVYFVNNGNQQTWLCDKCGRYETLDNSLRQGITFPPFAQITTDGFAYMYKAGDKGLVPIIEGTPNWEPLPTERTTNRAAVMSQ